MKVSLSSANKLFREKKYLEAVSQYVQIGRDNPKLRSVINFNLKLCERRVGDSARKLALDKIDNGYADYIVYSVLVGDYEAIKEPKVVDPKARYILFTDNPSLKSDKWEVITFDTLGLSPRKASRLPKLLPARYLPDHEVSLYIDASLEVNIASFESTFGLYLKDCDIAAYKHYERNCVYQEIEECVNKSKVDRIEADFLSKELQAEGYPKDAGLLENAFILRRNTKRVRELNELWFDSFISGPARDQLYLMPLLWRYGIPYAVIDDAPQFRKSPHVKFTAHTGVPVPSLSLPGPRRTINWMIGGSASVGWAYENNAKRLIEKLPEFDHVINSNSKSDCAIYFDTLIYQEHTKEADYSLLRLGGPNPVRRTFGDEPEVISKGLSVFDAIVPLSGELHHLASGASSLVKMIPNGVDPASYYPSSSSKKNKCFTLGFAANCSSEMERSFKGLDLVEAAAERAGVKLITLQKKKNQMPHDRMVSDFYHQIDCLVHPVDAGKEGCSNVIMEALACGVPVITTRLSGYHAEKLIHGVNVLFCDRNTDSLVEQISLLRNNSQLHRRLSKNGAYFARCHHHLDDNASQFRQILQEIMMPDSLRSMRRPRLRIGMLTTSFWPKQAGMEMMVHNLATALHRLGNDVVLLAPKHQGKFDEIPHEYQLRRCNMNRTSLRDSFIQESIEGEFDVLYAQGAYKAANLMLELAEELGIPLILRTHGDDIQIDESIGYGLRLDSKKDKIITNNLRRADVNVSISRHILRDAQVLAPDTDQRMISNGVDANHFDRPSNQTLHHHFNLSPNTRILLTVGRNVLKKSFHLAIEALALVCQKRQDVVLVHVGKDGNGENLRQAAERAGVSGAFLEYGEANYYEMANIYASADIFVFPSKLETFGNVTVEAMAAGLPCVEFDYGANHDKIIHGKTGYILPYGDIQRMAECILDLLSNKHKLLSFGSASKQHIRRTFDWPIIAAKYHDAFLDHTLRRHQPGLMKPRLRIAFVADKMIRIKGGGGEKSLTTLVNAMAKRGHDVFLIIKEPGVTRQELPFYPLHPQVTLCNICGWDPDSPIKGKRPELLRSALKNLQPDVVVGFFLPEFGYIARGCEDLNLPLLLSHRNDPVEKLKNLTERYPNRLPHVTYANTRAQVITVQMEAYLKLLSPEAQPKGVVIPNTVPPVPETMWAKPDKPEARNVILNVARLVGAKNQELMIRAFSRIAKTHLDWDIHIWGDGPLQADIEHLINELDLQGRVILKGTTQDIAPVYRDAKIFAFPSLYEGFSRALSEAMAHGLPSIGIEPCICSLSFLNESGGGIVTPDDVSKFAKALDYLICSPKVRREMGKKAQAYVKKFAPTYVNDLWEKVLFQTAAEAET